MVSLNFAEQEGFRFMIHLGDKVDHAFVIYLMLLFVAGAQDCARFTSQAFEFG
jgi:hypothetical protein